MPAHLSRRRLVLTAAIFALGVVVPGRAAELDPSALVYKLPDQIKWNSAERRGVAKFGARGRPRETRPLRRPKQMAERQPFQQAAISSNVRSISAGGTWWVGSGTTFDPDNSVAMPAGTFVTHFGKQVHWDGAKDEDATLLIVGDGPGTSTPAQQTAGRLSGIDPRAVVYTLPEQYKWRDPTGAAGTNQVILHGDPTKPGLYVALIGSSRAISASCTSIPTIASSPWSRGLGGWPPATRPTRTIWFPCRPAASSRISASRCIGTAPKTKKPGCSSWARDREL